MKKTKKKKEMDQNTKSYKLMSKRNENKYGNNNVFSGAASVV